MTQLLSIFSKTYCCTNVDIQIGLQGQADILHTTRTKFQEQTPFESFLPVHKVDRMC